MNTLKAPTTLVNAPADKMNPVVRAKIAAVVAERKIKHGTLSLAIAKQLYRKARTGDQMDVDGAKFLVVG